MLYYVETVQTFNELMAYMNIALVNLNLALNTRHVTVPKLNIQDKCIDQHLGSVQLKRHSACAIVVYIDISYMNVIIA